MTGEKDKNKTYPGEVNAKFISPRLKHKTADQYINLSRSLLVYPIVVYTRIEHSRKPFRFNYIQK